MKIEIGKIYKSTSGMSYLIVAKIEAGVNKGNYLGESVPNGNIRAYFEESGQYVYYAHDKLLPNKIKKEGWIARIRVTHNGESPESYSGAKVSKSEQDAKRYYPEASSYHKIEWEEEET